MTTGISTNEKTKLLYGSGGRSIEKLESKVYHNSVRPDVSIIVTTFSALTATQVLDNETDISRVNAEDNEIEESSDESWITDTNLLLSQIQRNGPTSEDGSIAFLRLCLQLEQIKDLNIYEKLFSKYKTKKIFRFFVEASSVIHKTEIFDLILSNLSKLKNKMFLGKCLFHLHIAYFIQHLSPHHSES